MYKSVRWIRTAPVLRMHNEVCTRQTQQPAASWRVRRLNIAACNLSSFQIRGHNGVMSPIYPKGGNSAADPAQPPWPQLSPPPIGGCRLVRVSMHGTKVTLS